MQCELCGKGCIDAFKVSIEGGTVVACPGCAKLGRVLGRAAGKKKKKPTPVAVSKKPIEEVFTVDTATELSDDFAERIRRARENAGLKQEDVAKAINEPSSLIHRIESGRLVPSPSVGIKIERKLDVVLYEKRADKAEECRKKDVKEPVTLGDVVVVRKGK